MLGVHKVLLQVYPDVVTIIVPRYPQHGKDIGQKLQKEGQQAALRSQHQRLIPGRNIYVVDTLGELRHLYSLTAIAVIGGSFFPGLAGHNISEAAAAGCAILTGDHVGHFSHMVQEMRRLNPLSVLQVSRKSELEEAILELFSDAKVLEARRLASKEAFHCLFIVCPMVLWPMSSTCYSFMFFSKFCRKQMKPGVQQNKFDHEACSCLQQ